MYEAIWNAETDPENRRVHFSLRSSVDDSPINPVVTGVKVKWKHRGTIASTSTNDIVALSASNQPGDHFIELTASEVAAFVKGQLVGSVNGVAGVKTEPLQAVITTYDPNSDGSSPAIVAAAVLAAAILAPIAAEIKRVNGVTVNGAGTSGSPWGP